MSMISRKNESPDLLPGMAGPLLPRRVSDALARSGMSFVLQFPDGSIERVGDFTPQFEIVLRNAKALRAAASLNELRIAEAYLDRDIEIEGDLLQSFELRKLFDDSAAAIWFWRFLEPFMFGQIRTNKRAISKHYDVDSEFFMQFLDKKIPSYTQGVYVTDEESLEQATARKFDYCFQALDLKPGDHVLDIGPGWGAWLEYASSRGIRGTGITISEASLNYLKSRSAAQGYNWNIMFADFLEFNPTEKYDAIVIMGVIEHLPQYDRVVQQFSKLIKPGGKIFLDGSADVRKFAVAKFLVKHVYPGNHSYMVLHDLLRALALTPLRLSELHNDSWSYYLTARQWAKNLDANKSVVTSKFGEDVYRRFRLYLWGTAYQFLSGGLDCYRLVISSPNAPTRNRA
jgi:cyclopropane-fatty-acyl-phospholipid synthase